MNMSGTKVYNTQVVLTIFFCMQTSGVDFRKDLVDSRRSLLKLQRPLLKIFRNVSLFYFSKTNTFILQQKRSVERVVTVLSLLLSLQLLVFASYFAD